MMARYRTLFITVVVSLLCRFAYANTPVSEEVRVWNNTPMTVVLPVNQDVRVIFPVPVDIQVPADTMQVLESLAPNQTVVYWKASASFDTSRVIATSLDRKTVYLLDLVATADAQPIAVRIEDPNRIINTASPDSEARTVSGQPKASLTDPAEIVLTRFAAQSLYAPARLVPTNSNIFPVEDVSLPSDFPLMDSQQGEYYDVKVVGAWSGYGRYITAVMVTNRSNVAVRINPAFVNGNFTHITPQHLWLDSAGSLENRTTLYLISDVPFASAIVEDGYGY